MLREIPKGTHMCLIFSDRNEALRDVVEFMRVAAENEGVGYYFSVETNPEEFRQELVNCGCPAHAAQDRIHFTSAESVYTPDGTFQKDRMLKVLSETYDADQKAHPGPIHYTGEMKWALKPDLSGADQLIQYEREVNEVCKTRPFSAICQYDANNFDPDFLVEVMRAHPYVLIDGMIAPSPYFHT